MMLAARDAMPRANRRRRGRSVICPGHIRGMVRAVRPHTPTLQDLRVVFLMASDNTRGRELVAQGRPHRPSIPMPGMACERRQYTFRMLRWATP